MVKTSKFKNVALLMVLILIVNVFLGTGFNLFLNVGATETQFLVDITNTVNYSQTGSWTASGLAGHDGPGSPTSKWSTTPDSTATFKLPSEATAGTYDVWYYQTSTNTFQKIEVNGSDANYVNSTPVGWYKLGTYELTAGQGVVITRTTSGYARATAIKFVATGSGEASPEPSIEPTEEPQREQIFTFFGNEDKMTSSLEIDPNADYKSAATKVYTTATRAAGITSTATKYYVANGANVGNWVQAEVPVNAPKKYDVYILIPYTDAKSDPVSDVSVTDKNATVDKKTFSFAQTPGWHQIGTYELNDTMTIKFETAATGLNIRLDSLKLVEFVPGAPSPLPSPSPSPVPSPSAESGNKVFVNETFDATQTDALPTGWRESSTGTFLQWGVKEFKSATDKSLWVKQTGGTQRQMSAPAFSEPATGENLIFGFDLYNKSIGGAPLNSKTSIILRNTASAAIINFDFRLNVAKDGAELVYFSGNTIAQTLKSNLKFDFDKWYSFVVLANTLTQKYDLYIYQNGTLIDGFKGASLGKGGLTAEHSNFNAINLYTNSGSDSTAEFYLDNVKIKNDPSFIAPTLPEISPSPSPSPQEGVFYIDSNKEDRFEFIVSGSMGDTGVSTTGNVSYGGDHRFSDAPNGYGIWNFRNIPSGIYEVYYHFPLKHDSNTNAADIEVNDNNGTVVKETYNMKTVETGTWQKIGTQYTLMSANPGYLKVQKKYPTADGMIRMDAIKFVQISAIPVPPRADNINISGILKPGETLTGSYQYVNDTGNLELGTIKKWYRSDKNDQTATWTEIGSGNTYTLKSQDANKYIKFEVIPKADTSNSAIQTGATVFYTTGAIPDGDKKPVASEIKMDGNLIRYLTLTATYKYSDVNLDPEGNSTYQWYRGDTQGNVMTPIIGATGTVKQGDKITYTLQSQDVGKYIRIGITPKNNVSNGDETYGQTRGPVIEMPLDVKPSAISPVIIGAGAPNREISAGYRFVHPYSLEEGGTTFQWYISDSRNGTYTAISGATGKTYTTDNSQMGKYLKVAITPVVKINGVQGARVETEPLLIKWQLVWSDEFDYYAADGLDPNFTANWVSANQSYLGWIDSGRWPKNVEVSNGTLKLKQFKEDPLLGGQKWSSGSVWTKDTYGYGMYEAKYKYAAASGLNQSFWLMTPGGYKQKNGYEIDINEGHYPNKIHTNLHWIDSTGTHKSSSIGYTIPDVADMSENFHIFNMDWNENEIVLYADGVEYRRIANLVARAENMKANIYFSEAVLRWAGEPSDAIDGSIMEVDYIRYYQIYDDNYVDKDPLAIAVEKANRTIQTSKVGSTVACYPQAVSFQNLQSVIDAAEVILNNTTATKEQVNNVYTQLNAALESFYTGIVDFGTVKEENSPVYIPENFGKEITINHTPSNADLTVKVLANKQLDKNVKINYSTIIDGKHSTVNITLYKGTSFSGATDAQGYVTIKLPKNGVIMNADVPGLVQYVLDMGNLNVTSNAIRISISNMAGSDVGYVKNTEFTKMTDFLLTDSPDDSKTAVSVNSMAISKTSQTNLIIWARVLSPIAIYKQSSDNEGIPSGGGNHTYNPSPKPSDPSPSPSDDHGTSPSPSESPSPSAPAEFNDISNHWAENEIKELSENGIIKGVTEDEFMPDKSISRAEFTALIVRILGLDMVDYENSFYDVKSSDWFAKEVQTALDNGIVGEDTNFRPNDTITREEMTKLMVEALMKATNTKTLPKADLDKFTDADEISDWAKDYVAQALEAGLIQGVSDNEFAPKADATRAQGAVMIYRFLGLVAQQ